MLTMSAMPEQHTPKRINMGNDVFPKVASRPVNSFLGFLRIDRRSSSSSSSSSSSRRLLRLGGGTSSSSSRRLARFGGGLSSSSSSSSFGRLLRFGGRSSSSSSSYLRGIRFLRNERCCKHKHDISRKMRV